MQGTFESCFEIILVEERAFVVLERDLSLDCVV